jgi:hypothetical protein
MNPRRVLLFGIGGIFGAAMAAYGQTPLTIYLPPVNLGATETAEIAISSSAAAYSGYAFVTGCSASVTFHGPDGAAIGMASDSTVADTRQIFSADLPFASTGAKGSDITISAEIALTPNSGAFSVLAPPIPLCAVNYSLETYDTETGVSHALVTGQSAQGTIFLTVSGILSIAENAPQNVVLSPIRFGASETAQVSVVNTAPASCQGSVLFTIPLDP